MANKKITELPLITGISGSTSLPIVTGGTTNQITAENFTEFSRNIIRTTANTFTQNQTITGNLSVSGNTNIGGNLVVAGTLTAQEYYSEITSASIIYSEGSTIFGNTADDTHRFIGSIILNGGETLGNAGLNAFSGSFSAQLSRVQQATASLQQFTASQDSRNFTLSQVTASFRGEIGGLEAYSASLKAAAIVSSSTQIQNYDVFALNSNLYTSTGSIKGEIAGIEQYTASLKAAAIVSSSTQIQNYDLFALNSNLYNGTGSIKGEISGIEAYTASLKSAAIVSSSTQVQNYDLFGLNSNLYNATGSLIGITNGLMAYTSSNETWKTGVRGEISAIEAWTASLDTLYATDAQLYQLYQATRSLELHSGSMIGITNGLMAYTASNETWKTGVRGEVDGIESYTSSLKAAISVSGTNVQIIGDLNVNKLNVQYVSSSILVTSGSNIFGDQSTDKHEFTGSVAISGPLYVNDVASTLQIVGNGFGQSSLISPNGALVLTPGLYGVQINGTYPDLQANGNITANGSVTGNIIATNNVVSSSTQVQNYDVFALNSNLYTSTGSLIGITNGLMALTASMKGQAIVSSSQQIIDYNTFAVTSSANTFYGTQTISGSLRVNGPIRGNIISGGLSVNGGITGSFAGNLSGVADFATTVVVTNSGTTTDTSLFPIFSLSPVLASYTSLYSHASSSFFYNGVTRRLHMEGFVVSGSNNIAEISGSLNVSGSSHTIQSGYVILQQVSQSLNFVDDTAAAAGGVPLGGLYRNGNFIVIRIV